MSTWKQSSGERYLAHLRRLEEIARLDLFGLDLEESFDDLTSRACERFGMPMSLISIVLNDSQFFLASQGLGEWWLALVQGSPHELSFCKQVVCSGEPFVVGDARRHPATALNGFVLNGELISYCGVPLTTANGEVIGAFCVAGMKRRNFLDEEVAELRELARQVVARLESRASGLSCATG